MARDTADGVPSALDAWQDFVQSLLGQVGKITGDAEAERTYRELRKEYRENVYQNVGREGGKTSSLFRLL